MAICTRRCTLIVLALFLGLIWQPVSAKNIGAEPRNRSCCQTCDQASSDSPAGTGPCSSRGGCGGTCGNSLSKGKVGDSYPVVNATGANGVGLNLSLHYASYNADGEKATIENALGYGWSHSYNIYLFKQRYDWFKMSPSGLTTKYEYKRRGRRSGFFQATRGHVQQIVQNGDGSVEITNHDGGTVFRFENITGNPLRVAGQTPLMLRRITERNDNVTDLSYANGLLDTVTGPYGRQIRFEYNPQNRLTQVIDPVGRTTTFSYDDAGNLDTITDPLDQMTDYQYNVRHQITRKTDRNGHAWQFDYDSGGHPVGVRDADGNPLLSMTNSSGWDTDLNQLFRKKQRVYVPSTTTLTDGQGNDWQYDYDSDGSITRQVAPDGANTAYTYDPATLNVATETDDNNRTTRYEYDGLSNLTKAIDALLHETRYQYGDANCRDKVSQITYPNNSVTTYLYDGQCNRTKETRDQGGLNLVREWSYDAHGNILTEKDPNVHTTTYEYDIFGNLIKMTDPENNVTEYEYEKPGEPGYEVLGNRTKLIDANTHQTRYEYDDLDRLIRETDPLGFVVEYQYDGNDNRTEVKRQVTQGPASFQITGFEYDLRNRLRNEIRDPGGLNLLTQYDYDGNDNRIATIDPKDNTTAFTYDVQNRLTRLTDALGNTNKTRYDGVGNRTCVIDANDHVMRYEYDSLNRLITETRKMGETGEAACDQAGDANDLISQYLYDSGAPIPPLNCLVLECVGPTPGSANIARSIDPEGKVSYFKYDKLDRRLMTIRKVTDTADSFDGDDWGEVVVYDPADNPLSRIDANGNVTGFSYYDNDWLKTDTVDPGGLNETASFTYDGVGNVETITSPNANITSNGYNDRNELILVTDLVDGAGSRVAAYSYDGVGNRKFECDGNDNCTGYSYDAVNRLVDSVDPMGETMNYGYDTNSNLIKVTDRENHATCHRYDAINRRTQTVQNIDDTNCTVDANDITTDTDYDAVGNVRQLTDANGNATQYAYDEADRLILETYADGTTRQFGYDRASNLAERTDQLGQITQYDYNDLYYLLQRDYQDAAEPDDSFDYDTGGRMTRAERDAWVVTFDGYDAANRLLQTTQDATGLVKLVSYSYDIPGRIRTIVYPGGRSVTEQMDARGRIADISSGSFNATYDYDLGNRVTTRVYNNGVTASYGYNDNNWITSLDHSSGGGPIAGFGHDYDKEGNKSFSNKTHDTANSEAYQYDDIYRLIDYKVGNLVGATVPVPVTQRGYDLDKVGNWDQFSIDDDGAGPGVPVDYNNTPNPMNEYDEDGPEDGISDDFKDDKATPAADGENWGHDDNGNRSYDGQRSYAYDDENRLIRVTRKSDSVVTEYQYDALGRRVVKTVDVGGAATETRYDYDGARVVEEQDDSAVTQATYVYGNYIDEVLTMQRSGQDYYYHQNALWSVVAVTDAAANVVERYAYTDYGCVRVTDGAGVPVTDNVWGTAHSAIGNPYLFTGRRWDQESGVYYYRARYYDCEAGRFLQRDPLGLTTRDTNLYDYVSGRPSYFTDALGLCETCCKLFIWLKYNPEVPRPADIPVAQFLTNKKAQNRRDRKFNADKRKCPKYKAKIEDVGKGFTNLKSLFDKYHKKCKVEGAKNRCNKLSVYVVGHGMNDAGVRWPATSLPPNWGGRVTRSEAGGHRFLPVNDFVWAGPGNIKETITGIVSVFKDIAEVDFDTCYSSVTADQLTKRLKDKIKARGWTGITDAKGSVYQTSVPPKPTMKQNIPKAKPQDRE